MILDYTNRRIRSLCELPEFDNNQIKFDYSQVKEVTGLRLNENPITDFSCLKDFCNLNLLEIDRVADIDVLPSELMELKKLEELSFRHNFLANIPNWIGNLKKLKTLNFQANIIEEIPLAIGKLTQLEDFVIDRNEIYNFSSELIYQLGGLKKLKKFLYDSEKLPDAIAGILTPSTDNSNDKRSSVTENLTHLSEGNKEAWGLLNQVKIIVLGGGGTGKTSLVKTLIAGEKMDGGGSTRKINIYTEEDWDIGVYLRGGKVKAHIWDFAGQKILHEVSKMFLSDESIYVLVDDIQEADRSPRHGAKYWLRHIKKQIGNKKSPVLVLFHKADEEDFEGYVKDLSENLKNNYGVSECLCTSIDRLETITVHFKKILKEKIREIVERQAEAPLELIKLRDQLATHKERYLSRDELKEKFQKISEDLYGKEIKKIEDKKVDFYINSLNSIGTIVKFESAKYKNTYVLNPNWIAEAVYGVINHPDIRKKEGEFTFSFLHDQLEEALKPYYEEEKRKNENGIDKDKDANFIITLMVQYKLCYPIDETKGVYLIPSLLSGRDSKIALQLSDDCLRVRHNYYVSNERGKDFTEHINSVFARFICETHQDIHDSKTLEYRKKDYLLLAKDDHLIEIFIVPQTEDKEIEIRVKGDRPISYLNIYNNILDQINKDFFGEKVKKIIPIKFKNKEDYHWQDYEELKNIYDNHKHENGWYNPIMKEEIDVKAILDQYDAEGRSALDQKEYNEYKKSIHHFFWNLFDLVSSRLSNSKKAMNNGADIEEIKSHLDAIKKISFFYKDLSPTQQKITLNDYFDKIIKQLELTFKLKIENALKLGQIFPEYPMRVGRLGLAFLTLLTPEILHSMNEDTNVAFSGILNNENQLVFTISRHTTEISTVQSEIKELIEEQLKGSFIHTEESWIIKFDSNEL